MTQWEENQKKERIENRQSPKSGAMKTDQEKKRRKSPTEKRKVDVLKTTHP